MDVGGFSATRIIMAASVVAVVGVAGYAAMTRYAAGTEEPAAPLIADELTAAPAAAQQAAVPTPQATERAQTQALTQEVHALIEAERDIPLPAQPPTPAPLVLNVTGNGLGPVAGVGGREPGGPNGPLPDESGNRKPLPPKTAGDRFEPQVTSTPQPAATMADTESTPRTTGTSQAQPRGLAKNEPQPTATPEVSPVADAPADPTPDADIALSATTMRKVTEADRLVQQLLDSGTATTGTPTVTTQNNRQASIESLRSQLNTLTQSDAAAN